MAVCKGRYLLDHQQGTSHHLPFQGSHLPQPLETPLLPTWRAEAATQTFVTSDTPGGAHTQKGNIYCFLLRTAFPASYSSISSRHRKQPTCQQDYSTTQHHGHPPRAWTLGTWAGSRGLELAGERELATFIPARILQVPSPRQASVTQHSGRMCFSWGY